MQIQLRDSSAAVQKRNNDDHVQVCARRGGTTDSESIDEGNQRAVKNPHKNSKKMKFVVRGRALRFRPFYVPDRDISSARFTRFRVELAAQPFELTDGDPSYLKAHLHARVNYS